MALNALLLWGPYEAARNKGASDHIGVRGNDGHVIYGWADEILPRSNTAKANRPEEKAQKENGADIKAEEQAMKPSVKDLAKAVKEIERLRAQLRRLEKNFYNSLAFPRLWV